MRSSNRAVVAMPAAPQALSPLGWEVRALLYPQRAATLMSELAGYLPFYVPQDDLLLLDWELVGDGGTWRAQPRLDLHSQPWLALPAAAIRPTGAAIVVGESPEGERLLTLDMPVRAGRRQPAMTLASGLMRMSMQAHDIHARFLPVIVRSDLAEDREGNPTLHLHRVDMALLTTCGLLDESTRKRMAAAIAERVLALMAIPGGGREQPIVVIDNA